MGTCSLAHQADQLAKHTNTLSISNQSLFGEGLRTVVAKATSTARDYMAMAEGFVQASMHKLEVRRAMRENMRVLPHLFMAGTISPLVWAGETGLPSRGGSQTTIVP